MRLREALDGVQALVSDFLLLIPCPSLALSPQTRKRHLHASGSDSESLNAGLGRPTDLRQPRARLPRHAQVTWSEPSTYVWVSPSLHPRHPAQKTLSKYLWNKLVKGQQQAPVLPVSLFIFSGSFQNQGKSPDSSRVKAGHSPSCLSEKPAVLQELGPRRQLGVTAGCRRNGLPVGG